MRKSISCLLLILLVVNVAKAQDKNPNPFAKYGRKADVRTYTQGRFIEIIENDTLVKIGDVVLNTETREIEGFVETDTAYSEATLEPEIYSFASVDPLTHEYPELTPYQFANNSPIANIDLDGLEDLYAADGKLLGSGPFNSQTKIQMLSEYEVKKNSLVGALHPNSTRPKTDIPSPIKHPGDEPRNNGDLHFSSVAFNLRGQASFMDKGVSAGPGFEVSSKSVAGSFNADASSNTTSTLRGSAGMSFDIGIKFSHNEDATIYNSFKTVGKFSQTNTVNAGIFGFYAKSDIDIASGDVTYKLGVQVGPNASSLYSKKFSYSMGVKGTSSEHLSNFKLKKFSMNN